MKKSLLVFTIPILLLFSFDTNAQSDFRFGVTGGVNISNFHFNPASIYSYNSKAGIMFGLVGEYPLSNCIILESGAILSQKGYNYKIESTGINVNIYYIEIPVEIRYELFKKENIGFDISAGIYGGAKISEKFSSEIYKINKGAIFSVTDFGLIVGTGINLLENNIKLDLRYRIGLLNIYNTNLFPERDYEKDVVNNRSFTLSIAYYFN